MAEETVKKIRLTKKLKCEEVEIEGEDGGVVTWKVKELDGPQRDTYLESRLKNFQHGEGGAVTGVKSYKGVITNLLQHTVYDENDKLVPLAELNRLPASTQEALFDIARRLSFSNPNKEAGEESSPTTTNGTAGENSPAS